MARKFSTESGSPSTGWIVDGCTGTSGVRRGCDVLLVISCLAVAVIGLLASEFSLLRFVGRSSLLLSAPSVYCWLYAAVRYGAVQRRQPKKAPFSESPSWTRGLS